MQCDVHQNAADDSGEIPYLLDIQANLLLAELQTRVVVPLIRAGSFGQKAMRLHPQFLVDGQDVVMATHLVAAVRRHSLGQIVGSLHQERDVVLNAVDMLWSGI